MDVIIKRKPVTIPLLPIVTALVLGALLFTTMRVGRVQANQIGVLVNNLTGSVEVRPQAGALVYLGLITDFYTLDNTTQTVRMVGTDDQVNIKSADGADVALDIEVNYRLIQDPDVIKKAVVPECGLGDRMIVAKDLARNRAVRREVDAYKVKWIRDYSRSVIRYVFGELRTGSFYDSSLREESARRSEQELNELLRPHGIEVSKVVPLDVRFYPDYEKIINDKKGADQEVQNQIELAKKALEEQKKKETEARNKAAVEIARAKGQLQKELVAAQAEAAVAIKGAEAYAIAAKKTADANLYKARNDAQSSLAKATAEADGLRQLAQSLAGPGGANVVKLEYAKTLQKAAIRGVPYATDPRIQKVEVSGEGGTARKAGGAIQ